MTNLIMNGFEFIDFMLEGGIMFFGLITGIIFAAQGVFTLLKWLKNRDNIPTLIISVGFFLGCFTIIFTALFIEIPFFVDGPEELVNIALGVFMIFGTISAGTVLGGMIWDFIKTKSEVKSE